MVKQLLTPLILLLTWFTGYSQTYPVQASTQMIPPYSVYLADYVAPGTERLALNIFLADINRPELNVRLRLRIEGSGILIETKPEFLPPPLILQGGVPERLISTDLIDYFNPNNLNFQGITKRQFQKTGALPEGVYRFCFEVLEYNRGVKVSNSACAVAWLILNDPPIINLPKQGEKLRPQDPQYVTFQWTPRHTGSPNSAFTTEYEFSLVEIWPEGRNPNDAILTSPPIFETTTQSTTLIYGPAETPLEPGRHYAFRVRARSMTGIDELDLFKNQGYSQTHTFIYGDACTLPQDITAEGINSAKFKVEWQPNINHTSFSVRYREAGNANAEWYEEDTFFGDLEITGLKEETTYEYQVIGGCGYSQSEYSPIATVTTSELPAVEYSCGLPPEDYGFQNTIPIEELLIGDKLYAGDFDVKITEITANNGKFSGSGSVVVPYLDNLTVSVDFTGITVNTDYRLISGHMEITGIGVDVLSDEVTDFLDELDQTLASIDNALDDISAGLDIADQILNEVGELANDILDNGPFTAEEEAELDGMTVDEYLAEAKQAINEAAGSLSGGTTVENVSDAARNVAQAIALKKRAGRLKEIYNNSDTLKIVAVEFYDNEKYGFDKQKYPQHRLHYNIIVKKETNEASGIPWVATKAGEAGLVKARLIPDSGISSENIIFKSNDQTLSASQSGNEWNITLPAIDADQSITVLAVNSSTGETVGKLDAIGYNTINKKVNVIPVGSTSFSLSASAIEDELDKVYGKAVADWDVEVKSALQVEGYTGTLQDDEQALLSVYSNGMRDIIKAFEAGGTYNKDEFYLFIVDKSQTGKAGYMPRKHRYGFIYMDDADNPLRTISHELGHGAFRLQHVFEEYPTIGEQTANLMDYGLGTQLRKYQWDLIHNPPIVIGLVEDMTESSLAGVKWFTPGWGVFKMDSTKTISGNLSSEYNGTIPGFKVDGLIYTAKFSGNDFLGYYSSDDLNSANEANITLFPSPADSDEVYLYQDNGGCGLNKYYKTTYKYVKDNKGSVLLFSQLGEGKVIGCPVSVDLDKLCEEGKMFFEIYSKQTEGKSEIEALYSTASLMCTLPGQSLEAFTAENEEAFQKQLSGWLMWGSDKVRLQAVREAFWSRDDAWQIYHRKLNFFIITYLKFKEQIASGELSNRNLQAIVNARTAAFLNLYTIEDRIEIIRNILPEDDKILVGGQVNYAELLVSDSEENAIVNVLKSVSNQSDAVKMLEGISKDKYIERLNFHLDDLGLGGNNFSALSKQFQRLMLVSNDLSEESKQKAYVNANNLYHMFWNDDNLFLPKNENGIIVYDEISLDNDDLTIRYRITENCVTTSRYMTNNNIEPYTVTSTTCDRTEQTPIDIKYFAPIVIHVSGDFRNQLPTDMNDIASKATITYAGFLDYLNEKQGTAQVLEVADYTLTGVSMAFGVGEVVAIIRSGASAGRIAIVSFQLMADVVDLAMKTDEFKNWCHQDTVACKKFKTYNLVMQVASLADIGINVAKLLKNGKALNFAAFSGRIGKISDDYKIFKNWALNLNDHPDIIRRLDGLSDPELLEFAKDFQELSKLVDFKDLDNLRSWEILKGYPSIRAKADNIAIIKRVNQRFTYEGNTSYDGLNKLFNEGSPASKQRIIDGLSEVDELFDVSLPVVFSAIKKGDIKVMNSTNGEEIARIVDGKLQMKKFLTEGDPVGKHSDTDILRNGDEIGFAIYSAFSKSDISSINGFSDNIVALAAKEGIDLDIFKRLQSKTAADLSEPELQIINNIRNSIPSPNSNTIMQKVIHQSDISKYLSGEYRSCKGYVSTAGDSKHLAITEDIYYGMRLDYNGTVFTPADGSCGVIRFKASNVSEAIVPLSPVNGGNVTDGAPFTGFGFTAANNGRLAVPEWKMNDWFELIDGAELWEVTSSGKEILRAIFSKSENKFIPIN